MTRKPLIYSPHWYPIKVLKLLTFLKLGLINKLLHMSLLETGTWTRTRAWQINWNDLESTRNAWTWTGAWPFRDLPNQRSERDSQACFHQKYWYLLKERFLYRRLACDQTKSLAGLLQYWGWTETASQRQWVRTRHWDPVEARQRWVDGPRRDDSDQLPSHNIRNL